MAELLLRDAKALLGQVRERTDGIIVAFSGGKDSLAVMQLCADIFPRVEAFFCYFVKGLRCDEEQLQRAERRYGIKIRRLPHPALHGYLTAGSMVRKHKTLRRIYGWNDVDAWVRSVFNMEWIANGMRMDESLQRRGMLKSRKGLYEEIKHVYPLWNWRARHVFAYLAAKRISVPGGFGTIDTSGAGLHPDALVTIKREYPDDYEKIAKIFPFIDAQVSRAKWYPVADAVREARLARPGPDES